MSQEINYKIIGSIIQKLDQKGCEYLVENGELPAVELTNEEMGYIKGGGSFDLLISIIRILTSKGKPQL